MSGPEEQEVRFMYLTQQGDDQGWKNWEGGETFVKEFNHVLTNRKTQEDSENPEDSKDIYTDQQLEKFRAIYFSNH